MPHLMAAKVEVSTFALGSKADDKLEKLATATRGKTFSFQDLQGNTALRMETAFVEATTTQASADKDYVTLTDVEKAFTGTLEEKFVLEPSLGNNTVVAVERVSGEVADMTVTLIDPSGKECHKCAVHGDAGTKKIVIPSPAQSGEWTLRVHSSGSRKMEVNVRIKSQARDIKDEPIRVTCRMGSLEVGKPDEAVIYADVSKGANVVLDATVVAEVTGPNPPHKSTVPLRDDGHDPDIEANDGTYSGYFVQFTGKGRYTVAAHVSSDHRARLSVPKIVSGSFFSNPVFTLESDTSGRNAEPDYKYSIDDFEVDNSIEEEANQTSAGAEPVGAFQRVAPGGSFRVTKHIVQRQVPPGAIGDLAVIELRPGANDTLQGQLVWTWPGAHLTSGNASAVEIRVSEDYAKLDSDFEQQEQITMSDVVEGSLDPLPAGTKHVVTLAFSPTWAAPRPDGSFNWKAFLAARVTNSDGLKSKTSNIVQVLYVPPPVTTTLATTTTEATTTEASTPEVTTPQVTTPQVTTTEVTTNEATTTEVTPTEVTTVVTTTVVTIVVTTVVTTVVVP
ncbi:calcium-activated chloride channel regulator 2-like isoform X2 [Dermacentor albipictus]|uniref:calcium-activated chloride channel regulator 2-like isoform X2 n=1 Tax=Dermacentor albipictus TaxID=60249 RepID=UPI0038FC8D54